MNLKQILMLLGNKLVERGFDPAYADFNNVHDAETVVCESNGRPTTEPIKFFTVWLNECPDAQEILAEMGVEWPVVKRESK